MDYNKLLDYGWKCQRAKYIHLENEGDYAITREGNTVYLMFQWTVSAKDWLLNFNFPIKPYKDMGVKWYCHRGFLKAWKNVKDYIAPVVADTTVEKFIIIGYSQGAAIAAFAHEYVWFNRPDLRENGLEGYGFASPRVYWGWKVKECLKERWANFYVIKNTRDIVTKVPPYIFGYCHTGNTIKINSGTINLFKGHMWTEYVKGINNRQEEVDDAQ